MAGRPALGHSGTTNTCGIHHVWPLRTSSTPLTPQERETPRSFTQRNSRLLERTSGTERRRLRDPCNSVAKEARFGRRRDCEGSFAKRGSISDLSILFEKDFPHRLHAWLHNIKRG